MWVQNSDYVGGDDSQLIFQGPYLQVIKLSIEKDVVESYRQGTFE